MHGGRRRSADSDFAAVVVVVVVIVTSTRRRCMQLSFDPTPVAVIAVIAAAASAAAAVSAVGHDNAVIGAVNRKLSGQCRNTVYRRLLLGQLHLGHRTTNRSGSNNCSRRHRRRCGRRTAKTVGN